LVHRSAALATGTLVLAFSNDFAAGAPTDDERSAKFMRFFHYPFLRTFWY